MNREYHKWHSKMLGREMELLVFGHSGDPVLFFPTRTARFYDYENWKIIDALKNKIEDGLLQIYCVDSIDQESFYCSYCKPRDKMNRHLQYELYILSEVIPFIHSKNNEHKIISAGCSMGAYHAANIAFRHPHLFKKLVGLSGRYDITLKIGVFNDLLNGYRDEEIYLNMPNQYLSNLEDVQIINQLKQLTITLAVGVEDVFLENNKHLSSVLSRKGIENSLFIWNEEAHKPHYWRKMLDLYL